MCVCERENQNRRQEKTKFWQQIIIEVVDAFKIFCLMKKLIPIWSKKSLWSKSFWYKQYCSIIDDDDEIDLFFLQHSFDTIYMQSVILFVSCHMINQTIVVFYYYNNNWNIHLKLNLNIHEWESKLEKNNKKYVHTMSTIFRVFSFLIHFVTTRFVYDFQVDLIFFFLWKKISQIIIFSKNR